MAESGLILTGRFEHRTDPKNLEMLGGLVCFYPFPEFAKSLPRPQTDTRLAWLCFTNKVKSKQLLGIPPERGKGGCGCTGQTTVQAIKYAPYLGEEVALIPRFESLPAVFPKPRCCHVNSVAGWQTGPLDRQPAETAAIRRPPTLGARRTTQCFPLFYF